MRAIQTSILLFFTVLFFTACKKTETLATDAPKDFIIPLQHGKYITYRLDSSVFIDHGTVAEVHSYHEKHVVDTTVNDAMGRPGYRVFRYIRDTTGTKPWAISGTYMITVLPASIEMNENNLRTIKLTAPIRQDNTWRANRYLPDNPLRALYGFQNDVDMEDWEYTYGTTDETVVLAGRTYDHVLTVSGMNRIDNFPIVQNTAYASIDFFEEKYAKGIGMIYQAWTMWDYQGPHDNVPVPQKHGFEIRRTVIDHN